MALGSFVYISDVDNLSDARYAAGMGVDLIGFKLDPADEHALNPEKFKEVSEWISGVKRVGEFRDSTPGEVKKLLDQFDIDYLLISDESQLHEFSQLDKPLILQIIVDKETENNLASTLHYCSGSVDYFLLESEKADFDEKEEEFIRTFSSQFPIILGYGVNKENADTIVSNLNLKGISLKGSSETRPGYKDFDEMADILEELEID